MPAKRYSLAITRRAEKEMADLPSKIGRQVVASIERLRERLGAGLRPQDMKRLEGPSGFYRLDSGEYRIVLALDEAAATVTIVRVRHRKDVYRNL